MKIFKNLKIGQFGKIFILLAILTGWTFAQTVPKPKPKPTPKVECESCPTVEPAAKTPPTAKTPKTPQVDPVAPPLGRGVENDSDTSFEKKIEVDENVSFSLCVSEGNVRINGWDRDEIRVFVRGGSKAGFRTRGKNEDAQPTIVTILGYDPAKDRGRDISPCLFGDEIELDVPKGANLTELKGSEGEVLITVESIGKAKININAGDIQLRNIQEGIYAKTNEGDLTIEDSFGAMDLNSINGNILVFHANPIDDDEPFKAKTHNGMIVLQDVTHLLVDAGTIQGSIKFISEIQSEGQYKFTNTSGIITLAISDDSSLMFTVYSHKDKFSSEIKYEKITENIYSASMKKLVGKIGDGEANVSLVTDNGKIIIKKQN